MHVLIDLLQIKLKSLNMILFLPRLNCASIDREPTHKASLFDLVNFILAAVNSFYIN